MSKNYVMVQYVFPPKTMPTNTALRAVIHNAAEEYIKAGKMPMSGTVLTYDIARSLSASNWFTYRDGHTSTRHVPKEDGSMDIGVMWGDQPQVFYRIFLHVDDANEFIALVDRYGALLARIVTEDQATNEPIDGYAIPPTVFVSEDIVAKLIWPGHPDFTYTGDYPIAGPADATPYPAPTTTP